MDESKEPCGSISGEDNVASSVEVSRGQVLSRAMRKAFVHDLARSFDELRALTMAEGVLTTLLRSAVLKWGSRWPHRFGEKKMKSDSAFQFPLFDSRSILGSQSGAAALAQIRGAPLTWERLP